jgi:hypothetical protein
MVKATNQYTNFRLVKKPSRLATDVPYDFPPEKKIFGELLVFSGFIIASPFFVAYVDTLNLPIFFKQ